jgi:hypothetical protein
MNYDLFPTIPRTAWPSFILKFPNGSAHAHRPKEKSQGVQRKCGTYAVASAIEMLRSISLLKYVDLDADEMFTRVESHDGGVDLGRVIEEALIVGYRPRGKLTKVFFCPTFDHQMSAVLCGFPTVNILTWRPTYVPDLTGWARGGLSAPIGSHEIMGYKPAMRPNPLGEWEYGIWHQNTEGAIRQLVLSEKQLTGDPGSGQGFACVSVQDEGP